MIGKCKEKILKKYDIESPLYSFLLKHDDLSISMWNSLCQKTDYLSCQSDNDETVRKYLQACDRVIRHCKKNFKKADVLTFLLMNEDIDEDTLIGLCQLESYDQDSSLEFFLRIVRTVYFENEESFSSYYNRIMQLDQLDLEFMKENISLFRYHRNRYFDIYLYFMCKGIFLDCLHTSDQIAEFKYALINDIVPESLTECKDNQRMVTALQDLIYRSDIYPLERWDFAQFDESGHLILNPFFETFLDRNREFIDQTERNSFKNTCSQYDKYLEILQQMPEKTKHAYVYINENVYNCSLIRSEKYLLLKIQYSSDIVLGLSHKEPFISMKKPSDIMVSIYNDNFYMKYKKTGKMVPLTLKKAGNIKVLSDILKKYLVYRSETDCNPFLREIADCDWSIIAVPLTVNEIFDYHNWNHLFKTKYKTADRLNWNFNRHNPNFSYYMMKTYSVLNKKSKNMLLNLNEDDFDFDPNVRYPLTNAIHEFISSYYSKKLNIADRQSKIIIQDYVTLKLKYERKSGVSLTYRSFRRIENEHNRMAIVKNAKNIKLDRVKKKSKFNDLQNLLPDSFEWIKTGYRLAKEAVTMHHCVAIYDIKIKNDKCAIYSFIFPDDNQRYTAEFTSVGHGKYKVEQVFGKYDKYNQAAYDYVESFMKNQ